MIYRLNGTVQHFNSQKQNNFTFILFSIIYFMDLL